MGVRRTALLAVFLTAVAAAPALAKPGVKPLLAKLEAAKGAQKLRVIDALGRTGRKEAVAPLLALFDPRKNSPRLTSTLVVALGRLKDERADDALIGTWDYLNSLRLELQSDFPAHLQILRATVTEALGQIGGARAMPVLHDALQDKDPLVVGRAATALGALRDRDAVDALIQLSGRGGNLGQSAVEALAEIGDGRAISTMQRLLHNDDPDVRAQAAYALVRLKDREDDGEQELVNLQTSERYELQDRLFAAYYLARLGSRSGLDFLTGLLDKGPQASKELAAEALGRAKNEKAVPPLAEAALRAKDASLRLIVARSLGQIGGTRAVNTLRRMADDSNQSVRAAAKQALYDLGEDD